MTTTPTSVDVAGRYWVHCPECEATFGARQRGRTENQVTKEAAGEYAIHYERTHKADAV